MPNARRGEVEIEIGGDLRQARLTMNDICELEQELRRPIAKILDSESMGLNEIRYLLWAGLRNYKRGLTVRQVGQWLEMSRVEYYSEKLGEMLNACLGVEDDDSEEASEGDDPKPQAADAGGPS